MATKVERTTRKRLPVQEMDSVAPVRGRTPYAALVLALALILGGGIIANAAQTDGGRISVRNVHFAGTNGVMEYGLLYIPHTATTAAPACGIVAIHGYINSHDTMDGFAIEMARRGCVVLAPDQTGHGYSDAPAFANGYGGPDALAYLHALSIVRPDDIGLIGHSMGGWASVVAAATHPSYYRSLVLIGSSAGTPQLEPIPGTPTFPKNVQVEMGRYSEFSELMWSVPEGRLFPDSPRLRKMFGVSQAIQPGKLYGSIAAGTARRFYYPATTHPGLTFSPDAIGDAVTWMQQTLTGVSPYPAGQQMWAWDELGTFLALVGIILLIFPVGALLLRTPFFAGLARPAPRPRPIRGMSWWVGVVILVATGVLSFYQFQVWGNQLLPASALFPQTITTGIMAWAVGGGVIGLALLLLWHVGTNRRQGGRLANYGVTGEDNTLEWAMIGTSLLYAVAVLVALYLAVWFLNWAFNTDARIWIFNVKIVTPVHARIILSYVVPFAFYFLVLSTALHGQLRSTTLSVGGEIAKNVAILVIGFVLFLVVEYTPLVRGGQLVTADQPLLSIVAYQFVPVYIIIGAISTYFFYKTGRIYAGAFLNALFITALIVTSTATQYPVLGG